MSRSYKKSKGSGFDHWDRESNSDGKWTTIPNKFARKQRSKRLRRQAKNTLREDNNVRKDIDD